MELPNKTLLATMISSALLLTACGGGGGSDGGIAPQDNIDNSDNTPSSTDDLTPNSADTDDTPISINPYSGATDIGGTVSLSSLAGADANAIGDSTTAQPRIATRSLGLSTRADLGEESNSVVKLYAMGADGELEDTGISCDITADGSNPEYICEGVADGTNYVVKYLRLLDNNQALEMKVNVEIPEGAAAVEAEDVSPQSTVIVDTIVNAVVSATEGKEVDQDIINDIINSVKAVVTDLVNSGAVAVPSMVVEAPKDSEGNFITAIAEVSEKEVVFDENENLDATAGILLSNEEIVTEMDAVKVELEVREIQKIATQGGAAKRDLIEKIFSSLLDGDADVPGFIVDFFTEQYELGSLQEIATLYRAIEAGIEIDHEAGSWAVADLSLSADKAIVSLQELLQDIYRLQKARDNGTITDEEKKHLAEIPGVISAIFPAHDWEFVDLTATTSFNVPQAVVFTIFVIEKYTRETFEDITQLDSESVVMVESDGEDNQHEYHSEDAIDFDVMRFDESGEAPGLLQLYGFFDSENLVNLDGVEISRLEVMSERTWISGGGDTGGAAGGYEAESLRVEVCVSDLAALAGMFADGQSASELSVELHYPTVNGVRNTVSLTNENMFDDAEDERGDNFENCFIRDAYSAAQERAGTGESTQYVAVIEDDLISDHASGEYIVSVYKNGNAVAERSFHKTILSGVHDAGPQLTSPRSQPQWPKECDGTDYCQKWDELQAEWEAAGGNTTFALNVDTDNDGTEDKAKVTLFWKKPDVELPEGVKVGYSVNLSKWNSCDYDFCEPEHLFSTHEEDRRIFGTSYTLPSYLNQLEAHQGSYQVHVCAEFIDSDNFQHLASGNCDFAQFNVGQPLDMSAEFKISGKANPGDSTGNWRVALIRESQHMYDDGAGFAEPFVETLQLAEISENDEYVLTPTIGDFLQASGPSHFSIVMFDDANDDGQFNRLADFSEYSWWPDHEGNIWFETWGKVLRVVSENYSEDATTGEYRRREVIISGGENVDGPQFSAFDEYDDAADSTYHEDDVQKPSEDGADFPYREEDAGASDYYPPVEGEDRYPPYEGEEDKWPQEYPPVAGEEGYPPHEGEPDYYPPNEGEGEWPQEYPPVEGEAVEGEEGYPPYEGEPDYYPPNEGEGEWPQEYPPIAGEEGYPPYEGEPGYPPEGEHWSEEYPPVDGEEVPPLQEGENSGTSSNG